MSNSILKKEFKERDVNRLRNLITGKYNDNTILGVGYVKPKESHIDIKKENTKNLILKIK